MKIEVLEVEEVQFNGALFKVPVKVAIDGKEYVCECEDVTGKIYGLDIEEIEGLKLGGIPENLELDIDTSIGLLKLRNCYSSLEIAHKTRHWRNNVLIDNYFRLLRNLALKNGFDVISVGEDENLYWVELAKMFPQGTETGEAYEVFRKFVGKADNIVRFLNNLVDGILSIILRTEPISSLERVTE
ncbi:MAG: hypothetical protein QXK47_00130 [Candidatus Bathyarchaeia archaeon]